MAAAAASALSYGITIAINRSLSQSELGVSTVLGARVTLAGVLLLVVLAARRVPLVPAPGERLRVLALGAVGYAFEAALFVLALERGSAAAVSLLFYTYPAMVTLAEIALGYEKPRAAVFAALGLSAAGSVIVVAAGSDVSISTAGVVLALGSAAAVSVFMLASARLVKQTDSLTTGAWVALGAGASFVVFGLATSSLRGPDTHVPAMLGNGVATASAFVLLFAAIRLIGATRTSVVMTLEAFFAIVLAAAFLGESISPLQGLGGGAILAATALVAVRRPVPAEL